MVYCAGSSRRGRHQESEERKAEYSAMTFNYHSHTTRCHHASGTQREFVERAIASGYTQWGFSDHTPYPFDNGYVSTFRMLPEDLEGYVKETLDLKAEYRGQLDIHLGLEVEYYPRHFEALLRLCEDYPIEYFLLGQHCTENEYDGCASGRPTGEESVLAAYCRQVSEAMDTGRFLYIAHPDLINYTGDKQIYDRYMRDLCRKAKAHGLPLEINLLGLMEGRNYPGERFWKIAGEEGADAIIGVDAHHVANVSLPEWERKAAALAEKYHLRLRTNLL